MVGVGAGERGIAALTFTALTLGLSLLRAGFGTALAFATLSFAGLFCGSQFTSGR
jgi:hypothetical protein